MPSGVHSVCQCRTAALFALFRGAGVLPGADLDRRRPTNKRGRPTAGAAGRAREGKPRCAARAQYAPSAGPVRFFARTTPPSASPPSIAFSRLSRLMFAPR